MKIANRNARPYVEQLLPFEGSNLYGREFRIKSTEGGYAVFSYGPHHPLFVAVPLDGQIHWFGNADSCSTSTTRHRYYCHPRNVDIHWLSLEWMRLLLDEGYGALVKRRLVNG